MRLLIAALLLLLALYLIRPQPADSQTLLPDNPAITEVIEGQMQAFRTRNGFLAWGYASPNIQAIFGTALNFTEMVQQGYPMVWNVDETTYLDLRQEGRRLIQRVQIIDASGSLYLLDYEMVEIEGDWRINGVRLLPRPQIGA